MKFQVRDGERVIEFKGRVLARTTSHEHDKPRWIELGLYVTDAGMYVLHGCGRTIVGGETDRNWVQLADEPEGIIDRLYLYNELGAKYMPHTSRKLLQEASEQDDAIRRAYTLEHVA